MRRHPKLRRHPNLQPTQMSLPRYLVSIDVFKATAIVIVLALHTFSLSGLSTERNGALLGFEMMSGLFYELAGNRALTSNLESEP